MAYASAADCTFTEDCTCFGCKIRSVNFAASCTPTRRASTVATNRREARWHRDIPAYSSLVREGVQPRTIDGCGDLVQTDAEPFEIESGIAVPNRVARREVKDVVEALR